MVLRQVDVSPVLTHWGTMTQPPLASFTPRLLLPFFRTPGDAGLQSSCSPPPSSQSSHRIFQIAPQTSLRRTGQDNGRCFSFLATKLTLALFCLSNERDGRVTNQRREPHSCPRRPKDPMRTSQSISDRRYESRLLLWPKLSLQGLCCSVCLHLWIMHSLRRYTYKTTENHTTSVVSWKLCN